MKDKEEKMKKMREGPAMKIVMAAFIGLFLLQFLSGQTAGKTNMEKAYRLLVRFQNGQFILLEKREIRKVLPLPVHERIERAKKEAEGYFFEILDVQDKILLRSVFPDPTVSLMEYPDPSDPDKIKSALVTHSDVVFSVVVPVPPSSKRVRFTHLRAAPADGKMQPPPEILGLFDLQ
jgi:hypothetical protein